MPDFSNFSSRCIKVIDFAQVESRRLGHNYIGTEQLLIGLIRAGNGVVQLLEVAGVNLAKAQAVVEKIIGRGAGRVSIDFPFTPRARRAIKTASSTARSEGMLVEPEHLLLAIVELGEGFAFQVLEALGASIPHLRDATVTQLQTMSRQQIPRQNRETETQTSLQPAIPPVTGVAPKWVHITTLPQENGRWVAQVNASSTGLDGARFRSIGYGDSDFEAIANALESLARMYRDYRA